MKFKKVIVLSFVLNTNSFFLFCDFDIQKKVQEICTSVPGEMGVAALHIESGRRVEFNSHEAFPMASSYKIPIALSCLSLVDSGRLSLNQHVLFVGRSKKTPNVKKVYRVTLRKCIELMLARSNNTTSDRVLEMTGGPFAVNSWLSRHQIYGMRIDRPVLKMRKDFAGITNFTGGKLYTRGRNGKKISLVNREKRINAIQKFYVDERDTTTPRVMVDLLAQAFEGKLVSERSTSFLFSCMAKCCTGSMRMVHLLPKHVKVYHKTGTMDGIISDVGVITLPGGKGHLVLAVYSNKSMRLTDDRALAIARIARSLFDYFIE
ncbi:TPA: hypothetical protein DEO28_02090 [Candidatus Dependentiae bacterium]|nr:MAG: Beta-lactamase class A [candidate division TM6 bacterium GW2011_GWE2_31_21]KKP53020.1 MAG: Beta-lactamase class A [candidate division TM6 bacterium GW2011_GWF2_33_332]HBS47743.1 hypothetical protein [Candidatus Dependentiae bacterium]HBZ73281.1 hypothetical protein [Candidatus Dependentiae bacterium]